MAKSIRLSTNDWQWLRLRLKQDYSWKPSLFAISAVMRRELGFTPRLHSEWVAKDGRKFHTEVVYLDFWDDHLETLFRLKYAEYVQ